MPRRPVPRASRRVAADDGHARLCESQFGADDVHDALARVSHAEMFDAEFGAVGLQRLDLAPRFGLGDRQVLVDGRDVVVGRGGDLCRACHADAAPFQACESHGRRHLVDVLAVDVEHRASAVFGAHGVRIPYLVQKCPAHLTPPFPCVRLRSVRAARRGTPRSTPVWCRCVRRSRGRCGCRTVPVRVRAPRRSNRG